MRFDYKSKPKLAGVYFITCKSTGRKYVGSSVSIYGRWHEHYQSLTKNRHANRYLQRAWNKFGSDNFEFTIVRVLLDGKRLREVEQYYIDSLESYRPKKGFNLSKSTTAVKFSSYRNRAAQLKVADVHRDHAKAQWADPLMREKMMANMREAAKLRRGRPNKKISRWHKRYIATAIGKARLEFMLSRRRELSEEIGKEHSSYMKEKWRDPEARSSMLAARKPKTKRQRKEVSLLQKKRWEDPAYRAKQVVKIRERSQSPEGRLQNSNRAKAQWCNVDYRRSFTAKLRKKWADPVFREFIIQRQKEGRAAARGTVHEV